MITAPLPPNEAERLAALNSYRILDTPSEEAFDELTRLAASITGCPMALVSLVDEGRQWFKSRQGLEVSETGRDVAFCAHAILDSAALVVPDAAADERFRDNPLVTGDPHVRFYAGIPLLTPEEQALGTLCVLDRTPRQLSADQEAALRILGRQVMNMLELRRALADLSALSESLQEKTRLLDLARDTIMVLDLDGQILYWNRGGEQTYGWRSEEAVGQHAHALLKTRFPQPLRAIKATLLRDGYWEGELVHAARDGSERQVSSRWVLQRAEDGRPRAILEINNDISARKQLETELVRARMAAEEASRAKSNFLARMSHEIRTPMNGILGMTELLLGTPLSHEQQEYVQIVRSSGESLLAIINDILDFSKIEAGKLRLEEAPFSLREKLGDTLIALAFRADQKHDELVLRVRPEVPDVLVGDVARVQQVMINLVANAIKFTERGEVTVEVSLAGLDAGTALVRFAVQDTGIGIPAEKHAAVFEAFEQGESSTSRRFGGTGLGLAISSQLVQLMGGRITLESRPGEGSTFAFALPLRMAAVEEQPPPGLQGIEVLLLEESQAGRAAIAETLQSWGCVVHEFGDFASAAASLESGGMGKRVLLIDSVLRGEPACAMLEPLLRSEAVLACRVVVLSSAAAAGEADRCREMGITYLRKPPKHSELRRALTVAAAGERSAVPALRQTPEPTVPAMHVLLAEDNAVNQKLALAMLGKMGVEVTLASDGGEALRACSAGRFDLVLMDVQMPGMDGFAATEAIRALEAGEGRERVPIVALTAHAMQGDRERCMAAGMDDYLTKPIRSDELRAILQARARMRPAATPTVSSLDRAALLERLDNDAGLMQEVLQLYREDCAAKMHSLKAALEGGDGAAVEFVAHALKGASLNVSAEGVARLAADIESAAIAGDLATARALHPRLQEQADALLRELAAQAGAAGGAARSH